MAEQALAWFGAHAAAWRAMAGAHPGASLALFVLVYAMAVAAFLPVALILTAVGGYLFGVALGAAASVAGATLGGAIGYGFGRTVLSRWVRDRFEPSDGSARPLLRGMRQGAFGYLLPLRLLPLMPFGVISLCAGAGRLPLAPYLAATALGIAPEIVIYAATGHGLGPVFDRGLSIHLSDLSRPEAALPLLALGGLSVVTLALRHEMARRRRSH